MIDLGTIRKAFDSAMLAVLNAQEGLDFAWLGVNARLAPDPARLWVITSLLPGRSESAELGGAEALAVRSGVYLVSLSFPERTAVDTFWSISAAMEARFRRALLVTGACRTGRACRVWCDEPWTANHGTSVEKGRCVLTTSIPWACAHS